MGDGLCELFALSVREDALIVCSDLLCHIGRKRSRSVRPSQPGALSGNTVFHRFSKVSFA